MLHAKKINWPIKTSAKVNNLCQSVIFHRENMHPSTLGVINENFHSQEELERESADTIPDQIRTLNDYRSWLT